MNAIEKGNLKKLTEVKNLLTNTLKSDILVLRVENKVFRMGFEIGKSKIIGFVYTPTRLDLIKKIKKNFKKLLTSNHFNVIIIL